MPYIPKVKVGNTEYNIKDIEARNQIRDLKSVFLNLDVNNHNVFDCGSITQQTISGITFTPHFTRGFLDYINVNGTATARADYDIVSRNVIPAGDYKISSFYDDNGYAVAYTNVGTEYYNSSVGFDYRVNSNNVANATLSSSANITLRIQVLNGNSVNNIKVYPLMRLSTDANGNYTPYGYIESVQESLNAINTKYESIESDISVFNILKPIIGSQTLNGITLTALEDGTYKVNGTATANTRFRLFGIQKYPCDIKAGQYKFICTPSTGSATTYYSELDFWDENQTLLYATEDRGTGLSVNLNGDAKYWNVEIYIKSGAVVSNIVYKPMLTGRLDATYDDYVQYIDSETTLRGTLKSIENKIGQNQANIRYLSNGLDYPYWVFHLDCGRKYISVNNIKALIDMMEAAGMNQIQLHFSDDNGFRIELDSMIFTDEDGTSYDLSSCLGGAESSTSWYNVSDFDTIVAYANSKGISVVPSIDMPGHMGQILSVFTQFKWDNTNSLDISNSTAVKFAKAIVNKYSKFFVSRGCRIYNFGFDEFGSGRGLSTFYANGQFDVVIDFAKAIMNTIKGNGMNPRMYHDTAYYKKDYNYFLPNEAELMVWTEPYTNAPTAEQLQKIGYPCGNMSSKYYWVLGSPSYQVNVTPEYLATVSNLLTNFIMGTSSIAGIGAVLSVWCDLAATVDVGDGGDSIVSAMSTIIPAFGNAIERTMTNY